MILILMVLILMVLILMIPETFFSHVKKDEKVISVPALS
jgi:hypothetical protein